MIKKMLAVFLLPLCALAQIPTYYNTVNFNVSGEALKTQLATLITQTHTTNLPYTSSTTTDVWNALRLTDLDPNNSENVLLIYGWDNNDGPVNNDYSRSKYSSCHTSSCSGLWVREHVYPRSLGTPNLGFELAGSDAHHLRSIDNDRNNSRSNRKFENFSNGSVASFVTSTGNWYPGDEWRGDVARMMMYLYLRYPTQCSATTVGIGSTSYSPLGDMPNIFLEWNALDPVSDYERNRNNILNNLQGNRNPFIDNPYLATLIWNGPQAEDNWQLLSTTTPVATAIVVYPTITSDIVYVKNTTASPYQVTVHNTLGQMITPPSQSEEVIDLSQQSKGLYFITIAQESQTNTFKVVLR